jgi:hypothetical protein
VKQPGEAKQGLGAEALNRMIEARKAVSETIEGLEQPRRRVLEEALQQPPEEGRERYIDKLLTRAQDTKPASVTAPSGPQTG